MVGIDGEWRPAVAQLRGSRYVKCELLSLE